MFVDDTNEKVLRQAKMLKEHFVNAIGIERLGILVIRSGREFPPVEEIDKAILQAAEKDVARGVSTH